MTKEELQEIRAYIVNNIMREPKIMFEDKCRDIVDLPSVIASLYNKLHKEVTGEDYDYMFHWANKCGAWVDDNFNMKGSD